MRKRKKKKIGRDCLRYEQREMRRNGKTEGRSHASSFGEERGLQRGVGREGGALCMEGRRVGGTLFGGSQRRHRG